LPVATPYSQANAKVRVMAAARSCSDLIQIGNLSRSQPDRMEQADKRRWNQRKPKRRSPEFHA
jgi:hypothetical protein